MPTLSSSVHLHGGTLHTRCVCTPKRQFSWLSIPFLKKNKYKKTFETMLNYFTIPEIDIAFTVATTKL